MFTGIIERQGKVIKKENITNALRLQVELGPLAGPVKDGDSIAVNGTCLTVTKKSGQTVFFDVVSETVKKTNLKDIKVGELVNLERAIQAGQPFGGHFVQGHVDGVGSIIKKTNTGTGCRIDISVPSRITNFMIEKGSIAVDGISLTLIDIKKDQISIALIPFTLEQTSLGHKNKGDKVNIEVDLLGKWVNKLLGKMGQSKLTLEGLAGEGF